MLLAENQVIERNIDHLPSGNVLLLDALPDDAIAEFRQQRPDINWTAFTPFFDTFETLKNKNQDNCQVEFGPWLESETTFDAVVIYYPKTKLRFEYYLSFASKLLASDGMFYVVGEKKGGVKSCDKALKPFSIKPYKLDAARHCMLFAAAFNDKACSKNMENWFSSTSIEVDVAGETISLDLQALPGVFSANRIDEGTELLLASMTQVQGQGLDFGCGCGVISAALAKRFDVSMHGVDVDALSVASSNQTFKINNVSAKALCSNGLSEILSRQLNYDFVATNPPFHTGIKTDYGITETLIKQLPRILKRSFQVWMVANHFLPYPEIFKRHLKPVDIKSKNNRFNIYHTESTINPR